MNLVTISEYEIINITQSVNIQSQSFLSGSDKWLSRIIEGNQAVAKTDE
ncbi:MAG: hypothetical protein IPP37_18840 [Saprospiraceae bacterium]|nr:hypothetical protein [Saprospiraceae bacterium]MBL0084356.1 hypothetical protein [Saprospiraceae bacterium]